MTEYFFIGQDLDSVWYVIPNSYRAEWFNWRDAGFPDEMPYWAREISSPEEVLFIAPNYLDEDGGY